MNCPYLKEYIRQCVDKIGVLPKASYKLCHSENYEECPFYIKKTNPENVCKNVDKCPFFYNFSMVDFDEFIAIANKFCLSENHKKCIRYIKSESGENVPSNLHPNGEISQTID